MRPRLLRATIGVLLSAAALPGCVENPAPPSGAAAQPPPTPPPLKTEPIGVQMTRAEPRLAGTPFRVLLDFERPTDAAFLVPRGATCQASANAAHTGQSALKLDGAGTVDVKLHSLLSGTGFPGTWTLVGGYFRPTAPTPQGPTRVTLAYRVPSAEQPLARRTVVLGDPQKWTPVFLDLTPLAANPPAEVGQLSIQVEGAATWCDDVVLVNNAQTFVTPPPGAEPGIGWTVRQGGLDILAERVAHFRVTLKTPEAAPADGWTVDEANDLRARFSSADGHTWTLYPDGRQYRDGKFSPLLSTMGQAAEYYAQQHASPATLEVPQEFGRIDRDTPGDRDNDGYNERRGSYQLVAKGTRFEVTLQPHAIPLVRPVLEISDLAPGDVLATIEGQLVEKTTRLPNGNLLIELPIALRRPTTLNISVK